MDATPAPYPESRADRLKRLNEKARRLPKEPGVYLMKDAAGVVLYVGKATSLPDRVSSYFVPSADLGVKKQPMLDVVQDFDYICCEGEWEALLTENRLIKDINPKFNARLTDDKTFPYLVITLRDEFPGVYITRDPYAPEYKGARVLGPFTSVYALRESIQLMQKAFKFRTCHLEIHEPEAVDVEGGALSVRASDESTRSTLNAQPSTPDPRRFFRPCLLYPIKQCTAPCAAKISREAYRGDIERFVRFLESKQSVMLREMKAEMEQASLNLEFERAAALRDQIKALQKLSERGTAGAGWQPEAEGFAQDPKKGAESLQRTLELEEPIRCIEAIDIAHLQGGETVGSKVCFVDGRPLKNLYRRYKIKSAQNDDYTSIREVVSRRYREAGEGNELYPDVILIDGGLGQLHAAQEALAQFPVKPPMIISLAKKEELIYTQAKGEPIKLGRENPGLKLCQAIRDEAHRFAQHYHHILRRKKVVGK